MKDACVLFPYYRDDFTTRHNYDILLKNNAGIDIYPLMWDCNFPPYLPHTVDLTNPKQLALQRPADRDDLYRWANGDLLIYDFFLNQPQRYERYVYIEADTICNIRIEALYQENWNDDLVCRDPKCYADHQHTWPPFRGLSPRIRDYYALTLGLQNLAGSTPLCATLLSLRCLQEVVKNIRAHPHIFRTMYCEIRIATAARLSHLAATAGSGLAASPFFDWFPIPFQDLMTRQPGIAHAVKRIPEPTSPG